MQRKEWFELHDSRWYPAFLRDLVTDALESLWSAGNSYGPVLPLLEVALNKAETSRIVDLCSGGGGPWPSMAGRLHESVSICLTDKYPNHDAFARAATAASETIRYEAESIDASHLPPRLTGFRTLFSSFHHFSPAQARAMLRDACEQQQGIAIFEAAKPTARMMLFVLVVPLLNLLLTPAIRPFRWSRLFWTYVLPVIPMTLLIDGWLSCLRSYSLDDMRELTAGLDKDGYRWECGIECSGRVGIQYMIGHPQAAAHRSVQLRPSAYVNRTGQREFASAQGA